MKYNSIAECKILLIEDDLASRLLVSEILEGVNITTIECDCGKEAIAIFTKHSDEIALILLDIKLPGMDGWELYDQLRKVNPEIPIIAVSATLPEELAVNCRRKGFNNYISKPFDINELLEMVTSFSFYF